MKDITDLQVTYSSPSWPGFESEPKLEYTDAAPAPAAKPPKKLAADPIFDSWTIGLFFGAGDDRFAAVAFFAGFGVIFFATVLLAAFLVDFFAAFMGAFFDFA